MTLFELPIYMLDTSSCDANCRYLAAEMACLDARLQRAVHGWQLAGQDPADPYRGLYISDDEADALLVRPLGYSWGDTCPVSQVTADQDEAQLREAIQIRDATVRAAREAGQTLPLPQLAAEFDLDRLDMDILITALAPETDLRYERLFAYLQDDVTRKHPTVNLILTLFLSGFADRMAMCERFNPSTALVRHGLVQLVSDPTQVEPTLLSHYVRLDRHIAAYLRGSDSIDASLLFCATCFMPQDRLETVQLAQEWKRRLGLLVRRAAFSKQGQVLYLQGVYGSGKRRLATALAREVGYRLLVVDGETLLLQASENFGQYVTLTLREARLQQALLYWHAFDLLLADAYRSHLLTFLQALAGQPGMVILGGNQAWQPTDDLYSTSSFLQVRLPRTTYADRLQLWSAALNGGAATAADVDPAALAGRFRLSGGQIADAMATARSLASWQDTTNGRLHQADLLAGCRLQSNRRLAVLAQHIQPHYCWQDIVLPADQLQQLREIRNAVEQRARVYEAWGFNHKLALGKGFNILFAGPSGTGKTMAADILAHELGLDLYKIDLSTVVSKYIGETEKNLARIFAEAETSNAILFFDEADALFGKRSEVRDAHDRYANIEISYLLQQMEAFAGIVILATNLRKNMDDAFARRMHITVEFPFPTATDRLQIWQQIWPKETPRAADLDLDFMARQFELAGGNIRNVALAAAFLAAAEDSPVTMQHLLQATRREYQKIGKVLAQDAFRQAL